MGRGLTEDLEEEDGVGILNMGRGGGWGGCNGYKKDSNSQMNVGRCYMTWLW
jgi:hypothetical protein